MQEEMTFTGFADRAEGGRLLAGSLSKYRGREDTVVIGLPRGGVVTAAAIAEALDLPLDVLVVRKLGVPGHEELAMGAVGPGGIRIMNQDVLGLRRIEKSEIEAVVRREIIELERRERKYRADRPPLNFRGKTVIVVDDGLATGSTMATAIETIKVHRPAKIVLAVPVAPIETLERFRNLVDEVVYLETPDPFDAVGYWYVDFGQVPDDEVARLLGANRAARQPSHS